MHQNDAFRNEFRKIHWRCALRRFAIMMFIFLFVVACFLAYSNGANDNFKGVATLFGSGTINYRGAITWATITTFLGSVAALLLAGALVRNFSGKGLIPDILLQSPEFAISIALGAATTVFLATKVGMPISTTHALVGALFGSGIAAVGSDFNFAKLGNAFLVPLIMSPLIAATISLVTYYLFRRIRLALGVSKGTFVYVGDEFRPVAHMTGNDNAAAIEVKRQQTVRVTKSKDHVERYQGRFMGINAQKILDSAHFLSSGVVSFARGLNDTPKIVGLLVVINSLDPRWGMGAVALAMAIGGLVNARKVGKTVAKKITPMNHGQGFTANLITGLLVTTASVHGMPVSTTHVSVGSIFGIGTVTRKADVRVVRNILLSWLFTLPVGAFCSAMAYWILIQLSG